MTRTIEDIVDWALVSGVTPAQLRSAAELLADSHHRDPVTPPTIGDYVDSQIDNAKKRKKANGKEYKTWYAQYLLLFKKACGKMYLQDLTVGRVRDFCEDEASRADSRGTNPDNAYSKALSAVRWLFTRGRQDNYLRGDPTEGLALKPRPDSDRRGLDERELTACFEMAATSGDAVMDLTILWLLRSTACRSGVLWKLTVGDFGYKDGPYLRVQTKYGKTPRLPISTDLEERLRYVASSRGVDMSDPSSLLLRSRNGKPLTEAHLGTMWAHIRTHDAFRLTDSARVSSHWIRHTTAADVRNRYGRDREEGYLIHKPRATGEIYAPFEYEHHRIIHDTLFGEVARPDSPLLRRRQPFQAPERWLG